MAEYDEGGVDAWHEGQGGDEVGHSVMDLDNYDHCIVRYEAVETVLDGLEIQRFKTLLQVILD